MDMTAKYRKFLIVCVVIFVGYEIARYVAISQQRAAIFRQAAMAQQQAIQRAAQQKAKAEADAKARAASAASNATAAASIQVITPNSQALTTLTNMSGIWQGQAALDGRGVCRGRLEMHPAETSPGGYMKPPNLKHMLPSPLYRPTLQRSFSASTAASCYRSREGASPVPMPWAPATFRKTWVFRLSELASAIDPKRYDPIRQSPLK
jgi:hypothetical protein